MNLTTEPWIPTVWNDGEFRMVSLSDVFAHGEEVSDLAVRPPERVSLMRLLICVAHAALDGPANREDWQTCRTKIAPCALDYLRRWGAAFDLFGSAQRYLQVSGLEKPRNESKDDEGNLVSKLDFALATGNKNTAGQYGVLGLALESFRIINSFVVHFCSLPQTTLASSATKGPLTR